MASILTENTINLGLPVRGVCFVAPELDRIGGYELATLTLARGLRRKGIPVLIVTTSTSADETAKHEDLVRIKMQGRRTLLHIFPRLLVILLRERCNYSVIHCPTFSHVSGLAILAGLILRRPTILRVATENDVREFADGRHWKYRSFFWLFLRAWRVIAPSAAIKDELLRVGFSIRHVVYLPNCVDVDRFQPAMPSEKAEAKTVFGLTARTPVIGTVARLVERKGVDTLLRAFSKIHRYHGAHLVIVGDGPLRNDLLRLASELGIDGSVSWLGSQVDAKDCLRSMDVFAFPSRLEGSPNALLEAMATGLPIVATAIGGILDLLEDSVTGLLIPPDDPDGLATALDRILTDRALCNALGCAARRRAVEVFSLSAYTSRLINLCMSIRGS